MKGEIVPVVVLVVRGRVDKERETAWMLGESQVRAFQNPVGKIEEEGRQEQSREFGTGFSNGRTEER
jgi:hypothetical protein